MSRALIIIASVLVLVLVVLPMALVSASPELALAPWMATFNTPIGLTKFNLPDYIVKRNKESKYFPFAVQTGGKPEPTGDQDNTITSADSIRQAAADLAKLRKTYGPNLNAALAAQWREVMQSKNTKGQSMQRYQWSPTSKAV